MSGIRDLVCLWTLFLTHSGPVQCSATEFLARDAGDSVVLPCLVDQTLTPPIGVYLKRTWLRRTEVLFKYQHSEVSVLDSEYDNRSSVSGDPSSHALNVTLSELRPSDTDRYICEFHINNPQSQDITKPGKTDFLLFVRGGDQCGCSSYSALIYALSSAVGVAAVLILVVVVMYRGKQQRAVKAHTPAAPIYEEMSVLQPKSTKQSPEHLEETQSVYRNVSVKKPCPENHYERPNGVPCPNSE